MEAFLAPGASLPLAFAVTVVAFTAGTTVYELTITNSDPIFRPPSLVAADSGDTTIGPVRLTPDQRLLIVALAEPRLRGDGRSAVVLAASTVVAARLGWTVTKFNRKLDNVCEKLERGGVRGLHGGPGELAANRRSRLVEYAVATRLVTRADLAALDSVIAGHGGAPA